MPERISVPALREALAENGIHPEVMTTKGLDRMAQDIEQSPARDTVEISDAAREAGGWEYYEGGAPQLYRRACGDRSEYLNVRGEWASSRVNAHCLRTSRQFRRLTQAEADTLALTNPAFAREHFAEQQSEEKPDRHIKDDAPLRSMTDTRLEMELAAADRENRNIDVLVLLAEKIDRQADRIANTFAAIRDDIRQIAERGEVGQ